MNTTAKSGISRRHFLRRGTLVVAAMATRPAWSGSAFAVGASSGSIHREILGEFGYGDVTITSELHEQQLKNTHDVLMNLSEDSLLKPLRQMSGRAAPGEDLGGWYTYDPAYDMDKDFDAGFAPACAFGQWISALARDYAITHDEATREKVLRLNRLYAETISADFYEKNRFAAYSYDKLLLGLLDSHTYANDAQALAILEQTTKTALPHLPGHAVEHDVVWRSDKDPKDPAWTMDESYTMPENLFLAYERGAGQQYFDLGLTYLLDKTWFDPLSRNENVLHGRHAYSYVNSLSSAMKAYMVAGSEKHLLAARNAFAMLQAQSYATGGWGPDEQLRAPESNDLYDSLTDTHHSFETPCGSYAHFKLTRYLLRSTCDSRYGDSMERTMYNTVLGAKPLQPDGRHFYYADYNFNARRVYKEFRWACCSGTLPQVAADYRINAYLRGKRAVYVNLYVPSTLRWTEGRSRLSLTQESEYPYEGRIAFTVKASQPTDLTLHFRIPEWAEGASIAVNGGRWKEPVTAGRFVAIGRHWKNGDRVDVEFPLKMRLEAIDARHPETAALLRGPLVLMAMKEKQDGPVPQMTREQLLTAKRIGQAEWTAMSKNGPVSMRPFTSVGDAPYTTYLKLL